jgi:DNA-binding LacI/PurR family transcriptional regulator
MRRLDTQRFLMSEVLKSTNNNDGSEHVGAYDDGVAQLAGDSQSTASHIFGSGTNVTPILRNCALGAADELGYQPDATTRALIAKRSNIVAVIISRFTNLYCPEILVQFTERLSEQGVRVLLFALESDDDIEIIIEQLSQYPLDGILAAAKMSLEQLKTVNNIGIPVVFF